jgi:hypothetical protein
VSVNQEGYARAITPSQSEVKIAASASRDARHFDVEVSTNVEFVVETEYDSEDGWLTVDNYTLNLDRGARPRTTTLGISWKMNHVPEERTATLHLRSKSGEAIDSPATIVVRQTAAPLIEDNRQGDSLAIIAIPFYRYRFLFRLKADNPEWSASKCMKECRSLTDGRKWRIFKHDCSYWKILLLPLIIGSTLSAIMLICLYKMKINFYAQNLATPESMVICFSVIGLYIAFIAVTIISAIYISLGQTILYRDMLSENTKDTDNTNE